MHKIDINNYKRKEIYEFFKGLNNPYYLVSFNIDINNLYTFTKLHNVSFYYALIYCVTKCINDVDAFHYCIKEDGLYHIDQREPSFTDLKKDTECFHIVTTTIEEDLISFCHKAKEVSLNQKGFINLETETEDLIYYSCIPWVETTTITNEHGDDPNDCIPRINWGKYNKDKILNISIEVNHKMIDGYHIGQFGQKLQDMINSL